MNILKMHIKSFTALAVLLGFFLAGSNAVAQEALIKKRFEERVVQGEKITSVKKVPYLGLYEVQVGHRIVYTDSKARYLFLGRVINIDTRQDYTHDRMEEINKINFSELPLERAIKKVNGKGERVIAVFSDPNCVYCKRLEVMLKGMDNLTVYLFPLNILSENSKAISRNIWCSADRAAAWNAWMLEGKAPKEAPASCVYSDEPVLQLARQYNLTGTPVIFFKNGSRITGQPSEEDFAEALSDAK